VARLVGFNGHPQPVPSEVVDALQARLASAPVISPLQPGDPVRITHGAFANIDAIFQRFDGDERVVILLHLLQRPQPVVVSVSSIEKREGAEG
ncbi:MAG: transcription termination/antitermination protein NusG, partial [Gammaproteobacteria bacterium]